MTLGKLRLLLSTRRAEHAHQAQQVFELQHLTRAKHGGLAALPVDPGGARVRGPRGEPPAEHELECDGCGASPIRGVLWTCTECKDYDLCICVHAEQTTLLAAARFGISTEGATMYSTMRPCFGCTKEILQASIRAVYYLHDWVYPDSKRQASYDELQSFVPGGVTQLQMEVSHAVWAVSNLRWD